MKRFFPLLAVVTLLVNPLVAAADAEVGKWLERMNQALHSLNYDGVFIYSHHGNMQSMRIIHSADDKGERERLISLSGPSREVIRDNDTVTCIRSDDRSVMVEKMATEPLMPFSVPEITQQIKAHYQLAFAGEDRIAGYKARKITITPRDDFRYGHQLWLAEENGLLLRAEVINEEGDDVEQLMFTNISFYDKLPEELLKPEMEGEGFSWSQASDDNGDETAVAFDWLIADMPGGFELKASRRHMMSTGHSMVEQQVFSDGLSSLSVFVESQNESNNFLGSSRKGAVSVYARIVDTRRVTVVGEVPVVTVKRVAESLYYPDNGND